MRPRSAEPIGASGHATTASIGRTHDRKQPDHPGRPLFSCEPGAIHTCDFSSTDSTMACGRIDIQADDVLELGGEVGIGRELEGADRCGCRPCAAQIRCTERKETPAACHRPAGPVGRFAGRLGEGQRHDPPHGLGAQRRLARLAGRVAQQTVDPGLGKPPLPAPHRGPADPARRAISATLSRSAEPRMIRARATCFWARLRSATIASKPARSSAETKGHTI